jgi:hypothetical protein
MFPEVKQNSNSEQIFFIYFISCLNHTFLPKQQKCKKCRRSFLFTSKEVTNTDIVKSILTPPGLNRSLYSKQNYAIFSKDDLETMRQNGEFNARSWFRTRS